MMTRVRKGGRRDGAEGGVCNPVCGLRQSFILPLPLVLVVLYDGLNLYEAHRPVRWLFLNV